MSKNEPSSFEQNRKMNLESFSKKIKVAFLSSFTLDGIEKPFKIQSLENKINCITYLSNYNQYAQEILNENSELYKFKPDLTFLILDTRTILGNLFYSPYGVDHKTRQEFIKNKILDIKNLIESFKKNSDSKLIISNFNIPTYSPYGIIETKTEYGLHEMINDLNQKIVNLIKEEESIYVYDFDRFVAQYGEENIFDYRQYFIGDMKIALKFMPKFAYSLMAFVKAIAGINKKCIILDLDNTLWGGIVGEDGFDGIKLGPNSPGNAFLEFQKVLFSLWQKGILLAINSNNNFDDAIQVIRDHPNMILRENNFASVKIDWENKATKMQKISNELNLGLDSFVYFDDDPVNRANILKQFPEILTVNIPKDPSQYAPILKKLTDFNLMNVTEEDLQRGKMYFEQKKRKDFQKSTSNLDEFLKELDIKIKIKNAENFTMPRISQLTLKTNQFNLTTQRYQEEDIKKIAKSDDYLIGCAQIEDKFGDNGITGVFIIKKENPEEWIIDTFLLSCRVMGRKVEDGILAHIIKKASEQGIKKIKGKYIETKKNKPCEKFLENFGFKSEGEYQVFTISGNIQIPDHLTIIE